MASTGVNVQCARLVGPDELVTEDQAELLLEVVMVAMVEDAEAAGHRAPLR